jgi:membrane protease YdiL (CAAX protease family)
LTQSFDIASVVATVLIDVIASYVVSSVYHPKEGVAQLLSSLKRVSVKSVWLWIALFLPFIFQILGAMIDLGVGGNGLLSLSEISIISIAASYPFILFFGGPLNEEPGWRAFALVKTQYNYTPLATGLIIGLIWSAWHLPLHITAFYDNGVLGFLLRFIFNVPLSVLFVWLFNRSNGNLFACLLLHAGVNVSAQLFAAGFNVGLFANLVMVVFSVFLVFYDKMYQMRA